MVQLSAWGNTYETTLHPIIGLQKKAVRIITFSPLRYCEQISPIFKDLNVMKFLDVIYYLNCVFMFKFRSNLLPSAFLNFFPLVSSRHKYKTRLASRSMFSIPLARANYGKFNIRFKGAILWNNIDESLKSQQF